MERNRFVITELNGNLFEFVGKLAILAFFLSTIPCSAAHVQQLSTDNGPTDMTKVTSVTGGMKFLLKNDDLVMLTTTQSGNTTTTSLVTMDTANSRLSGTPQTIAINQSTSTGAFSTSAGVPTSEASGRIYSTKSDIIAVINAIDKGANNNSTPYWSVSLLDPLTNFKSTTMLNSQVQPKGTLFTQVVMGEFTTNNLDDALVFHASVQSTGTQWGMQVLAAKKSQSGDYPEEGNPTEGPELYGDSGPVPVTGSIVVGDFNGDGKDEIAALLTDYQTIAFYSVAPDFTITQTATFKLPVTMVAGQVTLAAGIFRNQGANADLAVFGQIAAIPNVRSGDCGNGHAPCGYSVIPILITPSSNGDGTFTSQAVKQQNVTDDSPFFRFGDKHNSSGALAQAAPLAFWPQSSNEQLVLGIQTQDGAGYIEIGTFFTQESGTLDTFVWDSETERNYSDGSDYLENLWVANYDNLNSDGSHNPGLQIETYELVGALSFGLTPHLNIFNVNVPSPLPTPSDKAGNWLKQTNDSHSGIPLMSQGPLFSSIPPSLSFLVPADTEGRSLRLGSPDIVRIPNQIQPTVVLGLPPMHADYIVPPDYSLCKETGITSGPCTVNLTVVPSAPTTTSTPFQTQLQFTSSTQTNSQHKSTTSWGISEKVTDENKLSFNDGEENGSVDIKDAVSTAYNSEVATQYNTYKQQHDMLTTNTGLADTLSYSEQDINIYYYPVLGQTSCPSTPLTCSNPGPLYVEFSVPDNITYNLNQDATNNEWYQPTQEPGNIFSYPWSESQLQAGYGNKLNVLTGDVECQATDTSGSTYSTTWTTQTQTGTTTGNTNSFSNELSVSISEGAGVNDVDGDTVSTSFDITNSSSLNTLNETLVTLNASTGIRATKPAFFNLSNSFYHFGAYIFGHSSSNTIWDNQTLEDQSGQPVNVQSTGPMFVAYIADPVPTNPGGSCGGSSNDGIWWQQAYNQRPDVGLNHPSRWSWQPNSSDISQDVSFNTPIPDAPLKSNFYWMKGFFITKGDTPASSTTPGPSLADAMAGDTLTLAIRVYNFSLMDTPKNVTTYVRFYGQQYCSSGAGLCGNAFQIGTDVTIPSIPGFKSPNAEGNAANWVLANTTFDTSDKKYPDFSKGASLAFWVVTWMEDSNGKLVPEIADHGLTSIPQPGITQIGQVPIEAHSNNVGMFEVHNNGFVIEGQSSPSAANTTPGQVKDIELSASPMVRLDQTATIVGHFDFSGGPVNSVRIAYFDGDPSQQGKLIDHQTIHHIDAGGSFDHQTLPQLTSCGAHTFYAEAFVRNSSPLISKGVTVNATIDPVEWVQGMIDYLERLKLDPLRIAPLRSNLELAQSLFLRNDVPHAVAALAAFQDSIKQIGSGGDAQLQDQLARLTGRVQTISGCAAFGTEPILVSSNQISTTTTGLTFSRVTQTFNGTVRIQNIGGSVIGGPFQIVFTALANGVTLLGGAGNLDGNSFLTVPTVTSLAPGQSATVNVQFSDPSLAKINFIPMIYAGRFN
jgi:hypothetical protein